MADNGQPPSLSRLLDELAAIQRAQPRDRLKIIVNLHSKVVHLPKERVR